MEPALSDAIIAAQQVLVLRRVREGIMEVVPPHPPWLGRLSALDLSRDKPFPAAEVFPYLEAWMPELEALWTSKSEMPVRMGVWTEAADDGADLHLEATALALPSVGVLLITQAFEEHSRQQSVLQMARTSVLEHERLMAEISEKEILLHCVVHDLAGPLAGIQGCLELLAQTRLAPSETELVRMARLEVARQGRLIRDILDVFGSQIASMRNTDALSAPDLEKTVTSVVDGLRAVSVLKGVELRVETPAASARSWRVTAELSRLERVFFNLVENALRFAPPTTTVTVQIADEDAWIRVTILDEGPGVTPEILPRLFQRFVSGGRAPGKSGLGLFFCRMAVERWGGTIACDSGSRPGARFTVRLRKALATPLPESHKVTA
jgi:signal transduction histidine kinase